MKEQLLVLILMGMFTNIYAQSTLIWSEDFNMDITSYFAKKPTILVASDTIKVIGKKNTTNGQRLQMVEYDLNGDTISTKVYGNDSVSSNHLIDYKFDASNNLYLLQRENIFEPKSKIVIQKYSLDGNLIWVEQIQDSADTSFIPHSLGLANDTSFFVSGYKIYDYPIPPDYIDTSTSLLYLYAYNSDGNQLWQREFNPIDEVYGFACKIFVHNNTAFIFAQGNRLVKVDLNNNITVIPNAAHSNVIKNVQLTPDNNLLITAYSGYLLLKVDLNGSIIWAEDYETNLPDNATGDEIRSTVQDGDGNIYITGRHYGDDYDTPNYTNADVLTIKYDNTGSLIWENRYEYGINNADIGNDLTLKNGNVYVGGHSQRQGVSTDYDYLALKIDSINGTTTGVYRYNGIANGDDALYSLRVLDNNSIVLTGLSNINSKYDWTTQLLSDILLSVSSYNYDSQFQVFPNPINSEELLTIKGADLVEYSIVSTIGQIVQQGELDGQELNTLRIDNLSTGIYLLQLKTNTQTLTKKILVK